MRVALVVMRYDIIVHSPPPRFVGAGAPSTMTHASGHPSKPPRPSRCTCTQLSTALTAHSRSQRTGKLARLYSLVLESPYTRAPAASTTSCPPSATPPCPPSASTAPPLRSHALHDTAHPAPSLGPLSSSHPASSASHAVRNTSSRDIPVLFPHPNPPISVARSHVRGRLRSEPAHRSVSDGHG